MNLTHDAMLVSLRITAWSGRLYDRQASNHVAAHHDASASAGRYNKRLLPKAAFAALTATVSEARSQHYANSLPWDDQGSRLLTVATDTFSATLRALQSVGSTSRVLSADVPSLNGKPAQFYELLKTAYLREISTKTTQTGSETTLKPGEVSSGFALSYTARITAPDEVLVRLAASLRDRPNFAVFGTSQAQIQLPVYADRGVQATQRLRRGETLIVSGFSDRVGSAGAGGTFDERVPLPEGHRRASGFRQEQVLLVTAEVGRPLGVSETSETEL